MTSATLGTVPLYILAGGKSSRFGTDKARALLGGIPLIVRIATTLQPVTSSVTAVADTPLKYADLKVDTIADLMPGLGPLGGLATALEHRRASQTVHPTQFKGWVLVVSCDMISLDCTWVRLPLAQISSDTHAIVFRGRYLEPLFGLYHTATLPVIHEQIKLGRLAMRELLARVPAKVLALPSNWPALAHVNTPQELHEAQCAQVQLT